jgi:IS30 family transposase
MLGDKTNSRGYQMSYEHLSLEERHYIEISMKSGQSLKQISNHLDRAQSTMSREAKRNHELRGYRH